MFGGDDKHIFGMGQHFQTMLHMLTPPTSLVGSWFVLMNYTSWLRCIILFQVVEITKKQSIERSIDEGTAWNPNEQSFVVLVPVSLLKSLFFACNFCCLNPCNFHRICRHKFCRQVPSGTSSLSQGGSHQDGPGHGKTADVVPLSIGNQPSKNANGNIIRGHTNYVD